jgi:hypothetical protein
MRMLRVGLCALAFPVLLSAQDVPNPEFRDTAVVPFFREVNPDMVYFQTFYRTAVDAQHTLLLVRGGAPKPRRASILPIQQFLWGEGDLLGLFLQETSDPEQVWKLAVFPEGEPDWGDLVEVDRADSESMVLKLSYLDYGFRSSSLKLFFDISSKKLLGQIRYQPVAINQRIAMPFQGRGKLFFVGKSESGPVVVDWENSGPVLVEDSATQQQVLRFLAENPRQTLNWGSPYGPEEGYRAEDSDPPVSLVPMNPATEGRSDSFYVSFRAASGRRFIDGVAERVADGYKVYPFPLSTPEELERLRPDRKSWTIEEKIGPYNISPGYRNSRTGESRPPRLWFAKTFYDGESISGVGGVGYFDTEQREYVIFSPPELTPWSTSALGSGLNDTLWVGLVRNTEGANYSGGILHFDPATGTAKVYDVKEIVMLISPVGVGRTASIALGTANGIYLLRDEQFERFVVEPDLDGNLQIIAAPPPLD